MSRWLLTRNSKIKKMSGPYTVNWSLPAGFEAGGRATCPMAGDCANWCYAKLIAAGYVNGTEDDAVAAAGDNNRIGLVAH